MNDFDFYSFERAPQLDLKKLPFRAERRNFRHYIFWVDLTRKDHGLVLHQLIVELIQRDRVAQTEAHKFLQKNGVMEYVLEFSSKRPKDSYRPDHVDLFYLYTYIRTHKPKRVLEYGSGVSTLVMALALEQNGEGRLVSLDPTEEWARFAQSALPANLRQRAEVMCSRGVPCEVDGRSTVCFADRPLDNPDMIYIDGAPEGAVFRGAENVTFLEKDLEKGATIFIDGRNTAATFFSRPPRNSRYETTGYMVVMLDSHTGKNIGHPFGTDQFSNTMVRFLG